MTDIVNLVGYDQPFPVEIVAPATYKTRSPEPIGLTVYVTHMECAASKKVQKDDEAARQMGRGMTTSDLGRAICLACITGWEVDEGVSVNGESDPQYTPEKMKALLDIPNMSWIFQQLTDAQQNIANFTKT